MEIVAKENALLLPETPANRPTENHFAKQDVPSH
jgi:hypothetical protein